MKKYANEHYDDPFKKASYNCGTLVNDIRRAGGLRTSDAWTPNAQFKDFSAPATPPFPRTIPIG